MKLAKLEGKNYSNEPGTLKSFGETMTRSLNVILDAVAFVTKSNVPVLPVNFPFNLPLLSRSLLLVLSRMDDVRY